MLNQCIFIGKVSSVTLENQGRTKVVLETKNNVGNSEKIAINLPVEMALNEHLLEGSTIAIKARVSSLDAKTYTFIAERITILGGTNHVT